MFMPSLEFINSSAFANPKIAWFWVLVRVYVGYAWLMAGWEKLGSPAWTGNKAGAAVTGFLKGALAPFFISTGSQRVVREIPY